MGILARSLRSVGVDAWSVEVEERRSHLQFEVDERLGIDPDAGAPARLAGRAAFTRRAIGTYDVLHYFFGRSLLPRRADVVLARAARRAVLVHFRGRDVSTVAQVVDGSSATGGDGRRPRSSQAQARSVRGWDRWAHRSLISTPDLWREVPHALLVPQAIEIERWPFEPRPLAAGQTAVVGHAPTNRSLKGTHHVEAAVDQLRARGRSVELELIEGVSPTTAAARLHRCHVVVDQVVQGAYGNVSVQAMALGRPTLNHLDAQYASHGLAPPTVATTPATLADDLDELLGDVTTRQALADAGRRHVEAVHAGAVVAHRLEELYREVLRELHGGRRASGAT